MLFCEQIESIKISNVHLLTCDSTSRAFPTAMYSYKCENITCKNVHCIIIIVKNLEEKAKYILKERIPKYNVQ